jgi:hypothetical protein
MDRKTGKSIGAYVFMTAEVNKGNIVFFNEEAPTKSMLQCVVV